MRDTIIIFDSAGLNVKSPVSDNDRRMRQHPYQKFNVGVAGDNNVDRIIFKSKAFSKYSDANWFIHTCNHKRLFKDVARYEDGDITESIILSPASVSSRSAGTKQVKYSVVDSNGAKAEKTVWIA